ncbi:MAG: UspA protein [Chitinophagaceae bacterium]|nr:UspA protein [Chitinophagaceae bacterium]
MSNQLYNIMVPVDFSGKNKWAIGKAMELANTFHCNIHFVHIHHKPVIPFIPVDKTEFTPYESTADLHECRKKLEALKSSYSNQLCGDGKIEISVLQGTPRKMLPMYIKQYEMDLVVTGLSKFNLLHRIISSVSISRLVRKTNIPVLAVRSSGLISHFKKIVLPLYNDIPLRSIKMATMLGRHFKSTVYLVSLRQNEPGQANILSNTLEVIQSLSTIPVQSIFLEGKNLAKSTLEFSKKINADLIMVNPVKEFRLPGLWNRLTNKLLSYGSTIPVITMEQKPTDPSN